MRKVLIADDEVLVRIGLKSTIDWESYGFVIVGEARNGKEGLELFNLYDPDILLTDIRMPVMDGLELIQKVRAKKPDLKAVILTHYDDFAYAKEAIKLGASEYLLKSDLTPENLLNVLKRISQDIKQNQESIIDNDSATKFTHQKTVAEIALEPVYKINGFEEARDYSKMTCFDKNIYAAMCISIMPLAKEDTSFSISNEMFKSIEYVAGAVFNDKSICFSVCYEGNDIYFLFNLDYEIHGPNISKKLMEMADKLKNNLNQFINARTVIGISNLNSNINEIPGLLKKSKEIKSFVFFDATDIITFEKAHSLKEIIIPALNIDVLRKYVKTFETEHLKDYIDSFFELLYKKKDIAAVKKVFIDFLSMAKIIAQELNFENHPAFSANKFDYDNFNKLNDFETVRKYVYDIFKELAYRNQGGKATKYSYIVIRCIDFIKKNYNKNITLADVSEHVDISKSYLSLLFKQETGRNLINFINDYRIEKAKELLVKSNLKIYEIAERIGFENPYYFSKVFKEVAGVSCKEFKNSHYNLDK